MPLVAESTRPHKTNCCSSAACIRVCDLVDTGRLDYVSWTGLLAGESQSQSQSQIKNVWIVIIEEQVVGLDPVSVTAAILRSSQEVNNLRMQISNRFKTTSFWRFSTLVANNAFKTKDKDWFLRSFK
ncbi:hypothetical protein V6N13_044636 [Hibiscus sabdariffa]|uniref:Uncharacterized protein n=1 Tax=Hibiscus sabdariffa TaxID=183260 RepID=A0ABR2RJC7_9ROSI